MFAGRSSISHTVGWQWRVTGKAPNQFLLRGSPALDICECWGVLHMLKASALQPPSETGQHCPHFTDGKTEHQGEFKDLFTMIKEEPRTGLGFPDSQAQAPTIGRAFSLSEKGGGRDEKRRLRWVEHIKHGGMLE